MPGIRFCFAFVLLEVGTAGGAIRADQPMADRSTYLTKYLPNWIVFGRFRTVSDRFRTVPDSFDRFRTVSDRFGPFSDCFGLFLDR